jgi:hypothetical protein
VVSLSCVQTVYAPGARMTMSTTFSPFAVVETKIEERSSRSPPSTSSSSSTDSLGAIGEGSEENASSEDGAPSSPTSKPLSAQEAYDRRFLQSSGASGASGAPPPLPRFPSAYRAPPSLNTNTSASASGNDTGNWDSTSGSPTSSAPAKAPPMPLVPPPFLSTLSKINLGLPPDEPVSPTSKSTTAAHHKTKSSIAMTPIIAGSIMTSTMHTDVYNALSGDLDGSDWDAPRSAARRDTAAG